MNNIDAQGQFITRPALDSTYQSPEGERLTIAATWPRGVVFKGQRFTASARHFTEHFTEATSDGC